MTEWILTSSALILVVIALRGLLKDKLRPLLRYCLWGLVLVRLLLPLSLFESTLSLGNTLRELTQQTDSAVTQYEAAYDQVLQQHIHTGISVTPSQLREEVRQQVFEDAYAAISEQYSRQGISVPEPQIRQDAQVRTQTIDLLVLVTDLVPVIWYVGMALMTLAFLISNGRFSWKIRNTRTPMTVSGYPLPVFVTDYPATPCLFGLIRPKVYLTPEATRDDSLLRHVLAHERTHFRHGDHIWSALRGVCLVLHWYNPLVWAAVRLSKKDAELACDEATIRTLGEDERIAYGRTLIGMTCVKRDPRSFLITATTMISGKHALRERITAIARKPKNAILAVIACVLVLSIAAGCTFSGAPTEHTDPTTPTTALDAVYEKVQAAAQAINNQEALHVQYYISPEMPLSETDLASRTTYNEVWISGEDLYEVRHEQDLIIPKILHYHGSIYNHIRDNLWLPAVSSSKTPDDYRLQIPRRSDCTMFWIEANGYLDVTFANGGGTEIRLDADGKLVWYASYVHTTGSTDTPGEGAVVYIIMTYEDTNSQQIKAHLDTVAPQLINDMEIYIPANDTPPAPTGAADGGLSRATVQVGDRLYIFLGGMNTGSVPIGYALAGTVTHQDSENLPQEDLHGTLPVGTEIYVNPLNHRYIYYRAVSGEEVDVRQMERIDYAGYSIYDLTCDDGDSRLPVIYPDTPAEPPAHQDVFLYRNDPDWYLYDDLESQECMEGYLYTWYPQGDRLARKISDEPVVCATAIYNSVFYFTASGKLIQSDIDGYPYQILYTASGEPGNLTYSYPYLTFTDGGIPMTLNITGDEEVPAGTP